MAKKKSDQPEESTAEQRELERRVDAMMNVKTTLPETPPQPQTPAEKPSGKQPVDTNAEEAATAPQLPSKLLKTITPSKTAKAKKAAKSKIPAPPNETDPDDPPPERVLKLHIDEDAKLPAIEDVADESETEEPAEPAAAPLPDKDPLADTETDKAVDDITAQEADLQLAVDDARARRRNEEAEAANRKGVLATIVTSYWTWLIILGTAGVLWAWFR